ncbi:hypothetical protein WR25_18600 [Diploscapter pachys]|uniref:SXP/RAL-2 family protein Ani s 5-like cation-binding domain-containing protein n=1 Tax=Diploscapter pachys TaxID=2018661 RepID=A0A2A2LMS8_9BILA|nr:hypothetical protein WR25_18600 [Diploscapter pachys]
MLPIPFISLLTASVTGQYFEPIIPETTGESNNSTKPPCELPPFTHLLPLHYRRELKKIWAGYSIAAKKCERQLAQTRDLIEDLPYELKLQVIEYGKEVTEPPDRIPFLAGLSINQLIVFGNIMSNRTISDAEKYERLREWGEKNLDMDAVTQMEQFIRFLDQRAKRFQEKVSNLSPEAKTAHERLESLRRTKQNIYNGLSESAKKELAMLYRTKCPKGNVWDNSDLDADELHLACSHGIFIICLG